MRGGEQKAFLGAARRYLAKVTSAMGCLSWLRQNSDFQIVSVWPRTGVSCRRTGKLFCGTPGFDGGVYPASASALEDAEVLFISRKDFQGYCREHPEVGLKVLAVVGSRVRRLVGIIEDFASA